MVDWLNRTFMEVKVAKLFALPIVGLPVKVIGEAFIFTAQPGEGES